MLDVSSIPSYPVLPLRDIVVFPHMIVPLFVGREKSVAALETVMKDDKQILLVAQKNASQDEPAPKDIHSVGVVGSVLQLLKLPDGTVKVLVEGGARARIVEFRENPAFFEARAETMDEEEGDPDELEALGRSVANQFEQYVKLNKKVPPEVLVSVNQIEEPSKLADTIASHLSIKLEEKQELLEIGSVSGRLERVISLMEGEIGVLQVEKRIRSRVKRQMEKTQREYYLNEQMKAIQKELGEGEDGRDEAAEFEARIKATKLSKEAREKSLAEVKKLRSMSPMSAEATVVRNYLDWMLSIPWKKRTRIKKDIRNAEKILNDDHYGLEKVKERILEYLAVQQRSRKMKGPILCLVGPPGVGKTSLGKSVARATGRNFVRFSLGRRPRRGRDPRPPPHLHRLAAGQDHPVHEEGEVVQPALPPRRGGQDGRRLPGRSRLRPSRSTGSGTEQHLQRPLPGGRLRPLRRDVHHHGEHAPHGAGAARPDGDHPHPRLHRGREDPDRQAPPVPEAGQGARAQEGRVVDFRRGAGTDLIRYYTREAGVRNLERELANLARKATREIVAEGREKVRITRRNLKKFAGVRKFRYGEAEHEDMVGVTTGLAWTEVGGELLSIESVTLPGKGRVISTGKLGDVMKESVQAAESYVKSRAVEFGIRPTILSKRDIHVHVPEGATPKDGPSAGVAMVTSIVSVLTGIAVRRSIAMTGEITLRGRVLPIGGLKEKMLAALRGGLTTVLIPKENEKDLDDIPDNVKKDLTIVSVESMDDILKHALVAPLVPIEWTDADEAALGGLGADDDADVSVLPPLGGHEAPVQPPVS